jgi:universal stress protein A
MMSNYRNVLLALDLNPDNQSVINKAVEICEMHHAQMHLVHVVEPLSYGYSDGMIREDARKKLKEVGEQFKVDEKRLHFRTGRASSEIHDVVNEMGIDLIVLGTHGQAGLQLLLGSTANSVLHGATCDVLAVRIKDS